MDVVSEGAVGGLELCGGEVSEALRFLDAVEDKPAHGLVGLPKGRALPTR